MKASFPHRQRTLAVIEAVLSDTDLVASILTSALGPSGFDAACLVCKTWLNACRSDERVLRGVALYQGGLTKSAFMKLFAVTYGGGSYYLYRKDAVDAILANGGLKTWQRRLRLRAENPAIYVWPSQRSCPLRKFLREERLHARDAQQRVWMAVRANP
jgi:hypothetical protein